MDVCRKDSKPQVLHKSPGPFRRGAGTALYFVSWVYLWLASALTLVGGPQDPAAGFIILYRNPDLMNSFSLPAREILPFLVLALPLALLGGAISLAYDRLIRRRCRADLALQYFGKAALRFMADNWRFSVLWSILPCLWVMPLVLLQIWTPHNEKLLAPFAWVSVIGLYICMAWMISTPFVAASYFSQKLEGTPGRIGPIAFRAFRAWIVSFVLSILFNSPVSLIEYFASKADLMWPGLLAVLWMVYFCVNVFTSIFAALLIIHKFSILRALKAAYNFFNRRFFTLIRLTLDLLRIGAIAAAPILVYWSFLVYLAPVYMKIFQYFELNGGMYSAVKLIFDVLTGFGGWIVNKGGWFLFYFLGAFLFVWLCLIGIHAIKRIDDLDRAASQSELSPLAPHPLEEV